MSLEEIPDDFEISLIEFFIKTRKWLRIGFYKPPSQSDKYFLDNLSFILNKLTCQHYNTFFHRAPPVAASETKYTDGETNEAVFST